ncbi:hypothetical protein Niako_3845 [Niastella koreensis GR20-10]|uniref:Uncharacterized protein n=2 Tax=Niastella koreensis TaxID=354356 RepID=G8T8G7_NIAKG|nr:hypothetical protein Niako_3845 [Niastella koreensis GR20-10]
MTPAAILRLTQLYVPEFYQDSKHFKDSKEFLEHNEWGLALESLVEMATDSGHYFSEAFWLELATCAEKMQMAEQADYCRQQVIRNEKEVGSKTPNGWTTIKLDDTHYEHKIAEVVEDKWTNERHKKDNLDKLLKQDGFYLKSYGRAGTIYYIDNGRVLEISFEMSGVPQYDLLLFFDNIETWSIPKGEPLNMNDKTKIREQLLEWLKAKPIKTDLE